MELIKSRESLTFQTSRQPTPKQQPKQSFVFEQETKSQTKCVHSAYQINKLYTRFLTLAKTYSINLLIQIFLNILYYELAYRGDSLQAQIIISLMLADSVVSILLSIITLISRNQWHMAQKKNQQVVRLYYLVFDWVIILAQPYSFLQQIYIENWNFKDSVYFPYKLNYLLVILSLLKFGLLFPCLIYFLRYKNPTSTRICKLYGTQNTYMYSLKCFFKQHTIISVSTMFVFSLMFFSFVYRVSERDPHIIPNQFQYIQNCVWFVFITMTTVGFGDLVTVTMIGRTFGFTCTFCGVMIVSIMVLVVINTFEMDRSEEQALKLLKILAEKKNIKSIAAEYIRISLWRIWKNKKLRASGKKQLIQSESQEQKTIRWSLKQNIRLLKYKNFKEKSLGIDMNRQFQKTKLYIQNLHSNSEALLHFISCSHVIDIKKIKDRCNTCFAN